jgi:hypothetical protein
MMVGRMMVMTIVVEQSETVSNTILLYYDIIVPTIIIINESSIERNEVESLSLFLMITWANEARQLYLLLVRQMYYKIKKILVVMTVNA